MLFDLTFAHVAVREEKKSEEDFDSVSLRAGKMNRSIEKYD